MKPETKVLCARVSEMLESRGSNETVYVFEYEHGASFALYSWAKTYGGQSHVAGAIQCGYRLAAIVNPNI